MTRDYSAGQLALMIAWEQGELGHDDTVALFQSLIDTGLAWNLQGCYGRQAKGLLDAGLCEWKGAPVVF